MTVFNKNCENIINDLSNNSGFFPVNQIGAWHSGVHIVLSGIIQCPVSGTIIDCNFSDTETRNYFVIDSFVKNKKQEIHYYSILSDIHSYKDIKEYFDDRIDKTTNSWLLSDVLPYFTAFGLPYGIKAELKVQNYKADYITICGEQKILGSDFYFNKKTNSVCSNDKGNTPENLKYTKMKIEAVKGYPGFLSEDIKCGEYTISKEATVFHPDNNSLKVNGSKYITSSFEKLKGYYNFRENNKTIGVYGNISFNKDELVEFYEKRELFNEKIVFVNKDQLEKIPLLISELEFEISKKKDYKILRSGKEPYSQEQEYKRQEQQARMDAVELKKGLKDLEKLKEYLEKKEKVAVVSKKNISTEPYSKINSNYYGGIDINLNLCMNNGANDFAIYTADENLVVFSYFLLAQIRNCKNSIVFNEAEKFQEIRIIRKKQFDKNITGLKVIVDGEEQNSYPAVYTKKSICECRPYMFNDKYTYDFNITDEQDKSVYVQYQIKDWKNENVSQKKGLYVYSLDNQEFPIQLLEKNEEILKLENIGENFLKITLPSGIAYCEMSDDSLDIKFLKDSDFIGKTISAGTYIGNVNSNFVDWAMFFKENVIDELNKIKKKQLTIPKDTTCKKKIRTEYKLALPKDSTVKLNETNLASIKLDLVIKAEQADNGEIEVESGKCSFTKKLSRIYIRTLSQFVNISCKSETPLSFEINETGSKLNKNFYNYINIILKKISTGQFDCELQFNKVKFYVVHLEVTAADIGSFYKILLPITIANDCVQAAKSKNDGNECELTIFNDTVIETENCTLTTSYNDYDYHDDKYKKLKLLDEKNLPEEYFEINEGNETYYLKTDLLKDEGIVKDFIKEYCDELVTLNFGKSKLVEDKICPSSDSLICNMPELKDKLKDIAIPGKKEKLGDCFDIQKSNYLYIPDTKDKKDVIGSKEAKAYKNAVLYTSKLISKHAMEFDAEIYKKCLSYFGLSSDGVEILDIYNRISSKLNVQSNSFYFLYAPDFMSMLDNAKLLEFNPYVDNTDNLPTVVNPVTYCIVKSNPGFAPYSGQEKYHGYASITGHFNDWYGSYYHEGTDFKGEWGKTPIKALVSGTIVLLKDQGNTHYGLSLLVKGDRQEDGKNLFYLLGHLSRYETGITVGSHVSPGQTVAYVGNSGNCRTGSDGHALSDQERKDHKGTHLHLSVYKTNVTKGEDLFSTTYIGKYKDNLGKWKSDMVNPFDHQIERKF